MRSLPYPDTRWSDEEHAQGCSSWRLPDRASRADAVAAEDLYARAESTQRINECMRERWARAESELNSPDQKVLARFAEPNALGRPQDQEKQSVEEAQRHWHKIREANCVALWSLNADRTVRTAMNLGGLEALAVQRKQHLREGFPAGTEASAT